MEWKVRALALVALVALPACPPAYFRYQAGITTPDTPEANACRRQCLALVGSCTYYRDGETQVRVEAGRYSQEFGCPGMVSDCLALCPGAAVDTAAPPALIPVNMDGADHKPKGKRAAGWSRLYDGDL